MARSAKGLGSKVYKVEYWPENNPQDVSTLGPYSTLGAARGRLTNQTRGNRYWASTYAGRVLELSGEWKEVEPNGN